MENLEQNEQAVVKVTKPSQLHTVTPLSKYLATALFVALPFVGGWVGYTYAPEKVVEVEKVEVIETEKLVEVDQKITIESAARYINALDSEWPKLAVDYVDTFQPPPWAYYENGSVVETSREESPELQTGIPSETCESISKSENGKWQLEYPVGQTWTYPGNEDEWRVGGKYGSFTYMGFTCEKYGASFHFEGNFTMSGSTSYPFCLTSCFWFSPSKQTVHDLAFVYQLSEEHDITMMSGDLDHITSFHTPEGMIENTSNIDLEINQFRYDVNIYTGGSGEGALTRWLRFPIDGYRINNTISTPLQ